MSISSEDDVAYHWSKDLKKKWNINWTRLFLREVPIKQKKLFGDLEVCSTKGDSSVIFLT